jgi:hypothetical protein
LSPEGYEGGLLIDEMTIQQDIQFSKRKKGFHRGIKTHEHTLLKPDVWLTAFL